MPIHILEPTVAAQIAAGEVVERPASVARELIENAIDAGATRITVDVRGGGLQELRVQDNGAGIHADEIELAFARHATSKLSCADDLWAIGTLGFRGEALPSIASVAQVICTSRRADAASGVELRVAGGELQARTPIGCPAGTTISVRHLFYNTAVRREFLRSESGEASAIAAAVTQYALAYPEIRFTLLLEGRTALQTPGNGELAAVLVELYGIDVARQLLPVDHSQGEERDQVTVRGLISPPGLTRSTRSGLHLFINRRVVLPRGAIAGVIEDAYQNLLMRGRHPLVVLNIMMNPARVDVNVHPTKSEVKFRDPTRVLSTLGRAVRDTLLASGASLWANVEEGFEQGVAQRRFDLRQLGGLGGMFDEPAAMDTDPWASMFAAHGSGLAMAALPATILAAPGELGQLRILGQIARSYIIAETAHGLCLIDQHAAHERILYEQLAASRAAASLPQQELLTPLIIELSPAAHTTVLDAAEQLGSWGFQIEEFGTSLRIRAIPADLPQHAVGSVLSDLAGKLERANLTQATQWEDTLRSSLACHAAIRAGQLLSIEEMQRLLADLARCSAPQTCPHGRPTLLLLDFGQIQRQFGRTG